MDPQPSGPAPDVDDGGYALSQAQLGALAKSQELQVLLKDESLQTLLTSIDSSPGRERALEQALQTESFRKVGDTLLSLLQPQ